MERLLGHEVTITSAGPQCAEVERVTYISSRDMDQVVGEVAGQAVVKGRDSVKNVGGGTSYSKKGKKLEKVMGKFPLGTFGPGPFKFPCLSAPKNDSQRKSSRKGTKKVGMCGETNSTGDNEISVSSVAKGSKNEMDRVQGLAANNLDTPTQLGSPLASQNRLVDVGLLALTNEMVPESSMSSSNTDRIVSC